MGGPGDSADDPERPSSLSLRGCRTGILEAPAADKGSARTFTTAAAIKAWADRFAGGNPAAIRAAAEFALEAVGIEGRG